MLGEVKLGTRGSVGAEPRDEENDKAQDEEGDAGVVGGVDAVVGEEINS